MCIYQFHASNQGYEIEKTLVVLPNSNLKNNFSELELDLK